MLAWPHHPGLARALRTIKGVGPQIERALAQKGFTCLGDLLGLMPLRYQDRREATPIGRMVEGEDALVAGRITSAREGRLDKSSLRFFELTLEDDTGFTHGLWFRFPAHLRTTLVQGRRVALFGRVTRYRRRLQLVHPEVIVQEEGSDPGPEVRPVYPEIEDIRPGALRRIMAEAAKELSLVPTIFPRTWLEANNLTDPVSALHTLHLPPSDRPGALPKPEETRAWKTLAFFELLFLQLVLARLRARTRERTGKSFPLASDLADRFLAGLGFTLTEGQTLALADIRKDMARPSPMNRLLQGDVGCGKTVVALAAALTAIDGGTQAALMAPTDVLARQHWAVFEPHGRRLGVRTALLVGGLPEAEKCRLRQCVALGEVDLVIGTHTLITAGLAFHDLGLAVIDEQHRFGVAQRLALRSKANQPDLLVLTATPIPRSLALTLYGDLDLSLISQSPPGRPPIQTQVFSSADRNRAYQILAREIRSGGRAYVVAPRIAPRGEENGTEEDWASAEDIHDFIRQKVLDPASVGLVHGRMKPEDRQGVLCAFRQGRLKCLVATTVIEVGVDVPEASLMLIEDAHRFGLAQLHQLRGRVGRGERASLCLLVAGGETETGAARLAVMARSTNGFELAEEDLRLRGPGDPLGLRQSGLPHLAFARLPKDLPLLLKARGLAEDLIGRDPELLRPEFKLVREMVDQTETRVQADPAGGG